MSDDESELVIDLTLESEEKERRVRRKSVRLCWYGDGVNCSVNGRGSDSDQEEQGDGGNKNSEREDADFLALSDDSKSFELEDATANSAGEEDGDDGGNNNDRHPRRRKPRRTREEITMEAAGKKQKREDDKKKRALLRAMRSEKHVLRFLTVVIDPELISTPLGLRIVESFQQTQQRPEHEHIQYKICSLGINPPLPAAMWKRKGLESSDTEELHVLVCFEPQAFVDHVIKDQLKTVRTSLARRCPGYRVHIVVNGLERYLTKMERADFAVAISGKGQSSSDRAFQRQIIDEFVGNLLIHPEPGAFYDIKSPQQGAAYVSSLTKAIAKKLVRPDDSRVILEAKTGKTVKSKSLTALLSMHPLEDSNVALKTCVHALCEIPAVGPQIAHALATEYRNLGTLMKMVIDPTRSMESKVRELEQLLRTGNGTSAIRVGPKAAAQVVQVLRSLDPEAPVLEMDDFAS